jgi:hypothetical protein
MSQKLTLARYLEGRGLVKSLTRIEAEAFGVPYPLVSGWPARFGAVEITPAMLEDLANRIQTAKRSTANKARRGLNGAEGRANVALVLTKVRLLKASAPPQQIKGQSAFPGFARRPARRTRERQADRAP